MFLGDVIFADVDAPADVVCGLPNSATKKNLRGGFRSSFSRRLPLRWHVELVDST